MPTEKFTTEEVRRIIMQNRNRMFRIKFLRRNDKVDRETGQIIEPAGTERTMICRLHVKKGVQGVQPNRKERDVSNEIITVYEMGGANRSSGFKCVPLDSITEIVVNP